MYDRTYLRNTMVYMFSLGEALRQSLLYLREFLWKPYRRPGLTTLPPRLNYITQSYSPIVAHNHPWGSNLPCIHVKNRGPGTVLNSVTSIFQIACSLREEAVCINTTWDIDYIATWDTDYIAGPEEVSPKKRHRYRVNWESPQKRET